MQFEFNLINVSFVILFVNLLLNWIGFFASLNIALNNLLIGHSIATLVLSLDLFQRWHASGHFPLSNLYESLIFLSFTIQLGVLFIQSTTKNKIFSVFLTPVVLLVQAFATFALPVDMQNPTPLVPSLQSNWLMMHVTIMILSYGALLIGCILAIVYLVLDILSKQNNPATSKLLPLFPIFDDLSYRIIALGFPLLTLGILSGAVWANETWGSYWSWDPKETWALITWFTFALYFHLRLLRGWTGIKSARIASIGFFVIWVCYLGVNLLGKGLHSYGWWS